MRGILRAAAREHEHHRRAVSAACVKTRRGSSSREQLRRFGAVARGHDAALWRTRADPLRA